jgi:hypothetical protein
MSVVSIRAALETALAAMSPSLSTSWENQAFTPPAASTAYQIVNILLAEPDNETYGSRHREIGYMQVRLMYPQQLGSAAAAARADLIRTTFYRGASFTSGSVSVIIMRTPEIVPGFIEDGRYQAVVKVRFFANIN